jgi:hypothetical protein
MRCPCTLIQVLAGVWTVRGAARLIEVRRRSARGGVAEVAGGGNVRCLGMCHSWAMRQ